MLLALIGQEAVSHSDNILIPDKPEVIWGIICFVVVFLGLYFLAFPGIRKAMKAREDRIRGSLESAEEAKSEADRILDDYRAKLADARNESNTIIEEARRTAESMRKDLIARAQTEAEEVVVRARESITAERNQAVDEVRRQAASFSVELAERIVKRNIDRDAQARLIEEYINELERMGAQS
jgi:F-type H+-transporting ATPase subunit b